MYFVLGLFSGGWATDLYAAPAYLLGCNDPGDDEFYKQDKIAEQVVYGTEKEKLDTKWLTDAVLAAAGAATLGIAVNNIIAMTPLVQMSEGFQEANQSFFAGTVVFELLGSCLVIPIAEELAVPRCGVQASEALFWRDTGIDRFSTYLWYHACQSGAVFVCGGDRIASCVCVGKNREAFHGSFWAYCGKSCGGAADGDRMAGVQFLSDGKRHFVYGCDGSGRNSRCQPFLPEKIIRYIKTTFHYIFHKKSL